MRHWQESFVADGGKVEVNLITFLSFSSIDIFHSATMIFLKYLPTMNKKANIKTPQYQFSPRGLRKRRWWYIALKLLKQCIKEIYVTKKNKSLNKIYNFIEFDITFWFNNLLRIIKSKAIRNNVKIRSKFFTYFPFI